MKKSTLYCFIIFLSLTVLAYFFPIAGFDISWALKGIEDLSSILKIEDTGLISSILTTVFIKYKILRSVFIGLFGVGLFSLIKNIINKKNDSLMLIAFFLLFLMDRLTIASALVSSTGFTNYFVGTLGILLFLNTLLKDKLPKMGILISLCFGFILVNLELPFAFTIFAISIVYLCHKEELGKEDISLIIGEILGMILITSRMKVEPIDFTYNLLHEFIPTISNQNFIITLIFSGFVLSEGIKVYTNGKRKGATLSILGASTYLFSSLLTTNDYVNYITFVLYTISCLYILLNLGNSILFKKKIALLYLFEVTYIVMISLFGNIAPASTLPFFIIDIIVILEFYDQILPSEFLWPVWLGVLIILSGINIYIYRDAKLKYENMNIYIKNKLECTTEEIMLPSKYEIDLLSDYIPKTERGIEEYIKYYEIDVYDRKEPIKFTLRSEMK